MPYVGGVHMPSNDFEPKKRRMLHRHFFGKKEVTYRSLSDD